MISIDDARSLAERATGRVREAAWRIALAAATAAAAWMIAQHLLGQRAPIFAPIAAVVCLTDSPGVRGRRAVRLLGGVLVGVVVGEVAERVIGTGSLQIALSLAVGMLIVSLASINSLTLLQAGIAALLVVGTMAPQTGWTRLFSAAIGGVLALLVSQILFAPSPLRTLGQAAAEALTPPRRALSEVAAALREGSGGRARQATEGLRTGHDVLADFLEARSSADRLAVATVRGRREHSRVRAMQLRFGRIEYVYAGSVLLARTATEVVEAGDEVSPALIVGVEDLVAILGAVAADPRSANPHVSGTCPTGGSTIDSVAGESSAAHELSERLTTTEPAAHVGLASQLATQLRLLAEDVASLTHEFESDPEPRASRRGT